MLHEKTFSMWFCGLQLEVSVASEASEQEKKISNQKPFLFLTEMDLILAAVDLLSGVQILQFFVAKQVEAWKGRSGDAQELEFERLFWTF